MSASSDRSALVTCKRDPRAHEKDKHGYPLVPEVPKECDEPVLAIWSGPMPTPGPKPATEPHPILYRGLLESAKLIGRELACESGVLICRPACPRFRTLQKAYEFDRDMTVWAWQVKLTRIRNWLMRR